MGENARVAELLFFYGTMDCGKSTLALQMDHNHGARGRVGMRFTAHDREGPGRISTRLGLAASAVEVDDETDFFSTVVAELSSGSRLDYLICDEAQFYTERQVEQLARVVDDLGIDVFAFGFSTDFRTRMFPGAQRFFELADRRHELQLEALCWCGARATHNARVVNGVMVVEGDRVVIGDVGSGESTTYELLCRRHHLRRVPAAASGSYTLTPDVLPCAGDNHRADGARP